MKQVTLLLTSILLISSLPGCCRLVDWGKRTFYQGDTVETHTQEVRRYIRSVSVHNQFSTAGMFDALWLSDQVRTIYANLHSYRLSKDVEQAKTFLWRQLEENKHYISFYVLSLYDMPLGGIYDNWMVRLCVNNQIYMPVSIKIVDLMPEYRVFLACELSRFKTVYEVKFNAIDIDDNPIVNASTRFIKLCFKSTEKSVDLTWYINARGIVQNAPCLPHDQPYTMREKPYTCFK
jgi:hypothetical protein